MKFTNNQTLLLKKTTRFLNHWVIIFAIREECIKKKKRKKNKRTITFHHNLRSIFIESRHRTERKGLKTGSEGKSFSKSYPYPTLLCMMPPRRCIMHRVIMQALRGNGRFVNSFWLFCNIVGCGSLYRNRFTPSHSSGLYTRLYLLNT